MERKLDEKEKKFNNLSLFNRLSVAVVEVGSLGWDTLVTVKPYSSTSQATSTILGPLKKKHLLI